MGDSSISSKDWELRLRNQISSNKILKDLYHYYWSLNGDQYYEFIRTRFIKILLLLGLSLIVYLLYGKYFKSGESKQGNTDIPKENTDDKVDQVHPNQTVLIYFTPKDKLNLDGDKLNLKENFLFLMRDQYVRILRELLSYLRRIMDKNEDTSKNYFAHYWESDRFDKGVDDRVDQLIEIKNRELLRFSPGRCLLDLDTVKEDGGFVGERLIYLGDRKRLKETKEDLVSLQHQVNGMIGMLEIMGPGEGAENERDYKTLLFIINGIHGEMQKYLIDDDPDIEKDHSQERLIDGITFRKGMLRINDTRDQYDRDLRINKLLSPHERILSEDDLRVYDEKIRSLPLVGISNCGGLNIRSLYGKIDAVSRYRYSKFSLYQYNRIYNSLSIRFPYNHFLIRMDFHLEGILKLNNRLNILHEQYQHLKNLNEGGSSVGSLDGNYGDLIRLAIDDKGDLLAHYNRTIERIKDKNVMNMSGREKMILIQYRLMGIRLFKNMDSLMVHDEHDLNFCIGINDKIHDLKVPMEFKVPLRHIVFLSRLIDQCNGIVADRSCDVFDLIYSWEDYGPVFKGRDSKGSEEDSIRNIESIREAGECVATDLNQKRLLNLRVYSRYTDFDRKIREGICEILYVGDTINGFVAIWDLNLLKNQLKLLSIVMRGTIGKYKNKDTEILDNLSNVIQYTLPESIDKFLNDYLTNRDLKSEDKAVNELEQVSANSNEERKSEQDENDNKNHDIPVEDTNDDI